MKVRVRYLAQLRMAAGRPADEVELAGPATVADLLADVAGRHAALRHLLLGPEGAVQKTILIFVGDEQANADGHLQEGDEVTLMTPIAGGEGGGLTWRGGR